MAENSNEMNMIHYQGNTKKLNSGGVGVVVQKWRQGDVMANYVNILHNVTILWSKALSMYRVR